MWRVPAKCCWPCRAKNNRLIRELMAEDVRRAGFERKIVALDRANPSSTSGQSSRSSVEEADFVGVICGSGRNMPIEAAGTPGRDMKPWTLRSANPVDRRMRLRANPSISSKPCDQAISICAQ